MYDELLDDPKVQMLPPETFKVWVNLLCLASRREGLLPDLTAIAFALRFDEKRTKKIIGELVQRQLINVTKNGFEPHAWRDRQYQSDVSTDRVKRFRERQKEREGNVSETVTGNVSNQVSGNGSQPVSETPPDTEAETDTEKKPAASAPGRVEFDVREKTMSDAARPMPVATDPDFSPMNILISNGYSLELDILPAIEKAKRDKKDFSSWDSLVGWVETQHKKRIRAESSKPSVVTAFVPKAPAERTPEQLLTIAKIYVALEQWPYHEMKEPGKPGSPVTPEMIAEAKVIAAEERRRMIANYDEDEAQA